MRVSREINFCIWGRDGSLSFRNGHICKHFHKRLATKSVKTERLKELGVARSGDRHMCMST